MKKKTLITLSLCLTCLFSSCGEDDQKVKGELLSWDNINVEEVLGSTKEVPYETILGDEMFGAFFKDFTDMDNILQLKEGTFEDAAVAKPFKHALVKENEVVGQINVWCFPIVHDGKFIGFVNCDMRSHNADELRYFDGEDGAPALNEVLAKGSVAVFDSLNGVYGVCEDNTIVILEGIEPYEGELTFEQVNKGYNLVTAESVRDIVRTADSFKSEDEK